MPLPGSEPFLTAICARPADDTPRLVYADWLDDHGDPARAEFIRLQVELARGSLPHRHPSRYRAEDLRKAHGAAWKAELPRLPKVDWGPFARGFVGSASFYDCPQLAQNLSRAFAAAPIESVRFIHCRPGVLATLVRSPVMARVREVVAHSGHVTDDELVELAASPAAAGLESLVCGAYRWETTAAGARELVRTVTDRAAAALAGSPHLRALRDIRITGAEFSPDELARLHERFGPDPP
jgi:uncharacterized protein (TIGR02996 family)